MSRVSESLYRGLLEAAPDAIIGVDWAGRIALVNGQAERLFGYGRTELVGRPIEVLVPERTRAVHPVRRAGYFDSPQPRPMGAGMELAGRRKDGSEFPAEISLLGVETEDGALVSGAIRDVTERRRAVEAQARLAAIVDSSHDAIVGKMLQDGGRVSVSIAVSPVSGATGEQVLLGKLREVLGEAGGATAPSSGPR